MTLWRWDCQRCCKCEGFETRFAWQTAGAIGLMICWLAILRLLGTDLRAFISRCSHGAENQKRG